MFDDDGLKVFDVSMVVCIFFFFSSRRRHTRWTGDWSSDVCSSDLAATTRGVLVMSTPGGNSVSVAEHTFALLLGLARQVPRLDKSMHEGKWEKSTRSEERRVGKECRSRWWAYH